MGVIMPLHRTITWREAVSVGDAWFKVEHIYNEDGERGAVVAFRDPSSPSAHGERFLRGRCIALGQRTEIFSGVFITLGANSSRHRIRVTIEAPAQLRITPGFPYERELRLVV